MSKKKTISMFSQFAVNTMNIDVKPFSSELAMEAYIEENPNCMALDIEDSNIECLYTEFTFKNKKRSDVILYYGNSTIGIAELKLKEVSGDNIDQLNEYIGNRAQILQNLQEKYASDRNYKDVFADKK